MKINSIGTKLGLAGLAGILLSIGMVMNQAATESSVFEVNQRAEIQQQISDKRLRRNPRCEICSSQFAASV
jgi:hypothetical protein